MESVLQLYRSRSKDINIKKIVQSDINFDSFLEHIFASVGVHLQLSEDYNHEKCRKLRANNHWRILEIM